MSNRVPIHSFVLLLPVHPPHPLGIMLAALCEYINAYISIRGVGHHRLCGLVV